MSYLTEIAKFLQTFGGWGVSAIFLGGIIYLYRSTSSLLEKRNEQFINALKATTAALQQNSDVSTRVCNTLERVERRLDGDRQ